MVLNFPCVLRQFGPAPYMHLIWIRCLINFHINNFMVHLTSRKDHVCAKSFTFTVPNSNPKTHAKLPTGIKLRKLCPTFLKKVHQPTQISLSIWYLLIYSTFPAEIMRILFFLQRYRTSFSSQIVCHKKLSY